MKNYRLSLSLLIACVFIAFAATPAAAKDKWINLRTKNFNIVSNAGEGSTRELALNLEQFRYVFSKLFNLPPTDPVPVTVYAFKSDGSFKPFKPLYNGKPKNVAGYFQPGRDENIIALNITGNQSRPMGTILHEYVHLLTSRTPREWPLWLREGIAELYSTFKVEKKKVTLGAPVSNHVFLLREKKFVPLQKLFEVGHNSPDYNEREKQGVFYAQSWALAHYLMLGDKTARQQQLVQFIKLIHSGVIPDRAFIQAFNTDFAAVEKDLRRYIGNDSYSGLIFQLDSTEGETEVSIEPLADAEIQSYLGNLLFRTNRMEEAEAYFKEAASLDPELARPYEGLGFIAMRRNDYNEAKEKFKQAVARDSRNYLAHYYYAQALHNEAMGGAGGSYRINPELAKTITEEAKTAIKLMPGFAYSYYLVGSMCLLTGEDMEEGAQMLKSAIQLSPQDRNFRLMLAQIQVRQQEYTAAKETLAPLLASDTDPVLKSSAQSIMNMIESYSRSAPPRAWTETSEAEPAEAGSRPRLKRRGEEDRPAEEDRSKSEEAPSIRMAEAQTISGMLVAIECDGAGMVLALRASDKLLRFAVTDPVKLQFFSKDPQFKGNIGCGPINLPAFVYFKPMPAGKSQFAGDAVMVEFKKQ